MRIHKKIDTEHVHPQATLRKNTGSEMGYSQLHYRTPIKDNYLNGASNIKGKFTTPNCQNNEIRRSVYDLPSQVRTPQLQRQDSNRETPTKSGSI